MSEVDLYEVQGKPPEPDMFGHEYKPGYDFDEGYGRCKKCDCRENTKDSAMCCPERVFTLRQEADWILRDAEQKKEIERLREALEEATGWMHHAGGCDITNDCICGRNKHWRIARAALHTEGEVSGG